MIFRLQLNINNMMGILKLSLSVSLSGVEAAYIFHFILFNANRTEEKKNIREKVYKKLHKVWLNYIHIIIIMIIHV